MTKIDDMTTDVIAEMLLSLNSKQLQQLVNSNRERGVAIRGARIKRTEDYFARVKREGLYPHNYETFAQFREVLP